jgi:hypothetical protein
LPVLIIRVSYSFTTLAFLIVIQTPLTIVSVEGAILGLEMPICHEMACGGHIQRILRLIYFDVPVHSVKPLLAMVIITRQRHKTFAWIANGVAQQLATAAQLVRHSYTTHVFRPKEESPWWWLFLELGRIRR